MTPDVATETSARGLRLVLRSGDTSMGIAPAEGGRVSSLLVEGQERLVTAPPQDCPPALAGLLWGMYLVAPWVGRLAGARLNWNGEVLTFPANLGRHAIHGLVAEQPWTVVDQGSDHARMEISLAVCGWPLGGTASQTIRLARDGFVATASITAERPMPVSLGWHPWIARPPAADIALEVKAHHVLVTDDEMLTTGALEPVQGELDLRLGPTLGSRRLDHSYVDVSGPITVTLPDLVLRIRYSPSVTNVLVHTPENAVCIEGQTAWPGAHQHQGSQLRSTGLRVLGAGDTLEASQHWTWNRRRPA